MKYILIGLLAVVLVVVGLGLAGRKFVSELNEVAQEKNSQPDPNQITQITTTEYKWYQDPLAGYTVAVFDKPLEFLFTPIQSQTLSEQAATNQLELAVNGSYFRGSYIRAEHSGLLQLKGSKKFEYVPHVQISHVLVYNHEQDSLEVIRAREFNQLDYTSSKYSLIQTGPLVIEAGEVQTKFINGSLNGELAAFRTLLGFSASGEKFLIVATKPFKLADLAEELLENPLLKNQQITVINLDGGASTAMYSQEYDKFSFRDNVRLPLVIGVPKGKALGKQKPSN
jgi:exopolysaccharide biosynthesis protein